MKGESAMSDNCKVRNEEFTAIDIWLAILGGLPKYISDELDDHPEEYCSLTYEYRCNLLSTIEVKYESKRAAVHINKISSAGAASLYDSNNSVRIPNKKKAKTGVLRSNKLPKKTHRHHGIQFYCVLFKKSGMTDINYTSHSSKDYTGARTNQSIKYGIRGPVVSRANSVIHYKKSEKYE